MRGQLRAHREPNHRIRLCFFDQRDCAVQHPQLHQLGQRWLGAGLRAVCRHLHQHPESHCLRFGYQQLTELPCRCQSNSLRAMQQRIRFVDQRAVFKRRSGFLRRIFIPHNLLSLPRRLLLEHGNESMPVGVDTKLCEVH